MFIENFKLYNPFEATAIKRKTLSKPMRFLYDKGLLSGKGLDYATGHGFDTKYLNELGIDIVGYDKFNPKFKDDNLLNDTYDFITCLYCFNTIPELEEHQGVLETIKNLSNNLYIALRADEKAVKANWRYDDRLRGYRTSSSFQRFYNENLIKELFGEVEYIHNGKDFKLIKLIHNK